MAKSTISCVLSTYPVKQRVPSRNEVRRRQLCTLTNAVACLRYLLEISKQLASQIKQQLENKTTSKRASKIVLTATKVQRPCIGNNCYQVASSIKPY